MSASSDAPDMAYKNYSNLFVYSGANKAGMGAIDKEKQAQIIYEMSKNSAYFKKAMKLDELTDEKVKGIQANIDTISTNLQKKLQLQVATRSIELEKRRSFSNICCVLDMDMFFAAVEIRDQPELKDLPVAVGGEMMISTANYVARKYGVRAAMPGFVAKKLCPQLVFVNCNFKKYEVVAEQIRSIIGEYDPHFRSHSLDEVYFDLTAAAKERARQATRVEGTLTESLNSSTTAGVADTNNPPRNMNRHADEDDDSDGNEDCDTRSTFATDNNDRNDDCVSDIFALRCIAVTILHEIRQRIKAATGGLTASAGLAHNFYLAKIGADINKPDGQYELGPTREQVMDFVTILPVRKVGGIGKVTENILTKLGMKTLGDVRENMYKVLHSFTPTASEFLLRVSLGIAEEEGEVAKRAVPEGAVTRKSIGCERTFSAKGISIPEELYAKLTHICKHLGADMLSEDLWGKTVTLKLKTVKFDLITRSVSSKAFIQSAADIERLAKQILVAHMPVNIRLMGVSVSKFKNAYDPDAPAATGGQRNVLQFFSKAAGAATATTADNGLNTGDDCSNGTRGSSSTLRLRDVIGVDGDGDGEGGASVESIEASAENTRSYDSYSSHCHAQLELSPHCKLGIVPERGASLFEAVMSLSQQGESPRPLSQTSVNTPSTFICPVCATTSCPSLELLNDHIDLCLAGVSDQHPSDLPAASNSSAGAKKQGSASSSGAGGISSFFKRETASSGSSSNSAGADLSSGGITAAAELDNSADFYSFHDLYFDRPRRAVGVAVAADGEAARKKQKTAAASKVSGDKNSSSSGGICKYFGK